MRKFFRQRTSVLLSGAAAGSCFLVLVALAGDFWLALALIFAWQLISSALGPVRQSYLNGLIPSEQRATVLSFDSLMGSSGGIFVQPALGKIADLWSYPASYLTAAGIHVAALPFLWLAKREKVDSDHFDAHERT